MPMIALPHVETMFTGLDRDDVILYHTSRETSYQMIIELCMGHNHPERKLAQIRRLVVAQNAKYVMEEIVVNAHHLFHIVLYT